MIFQWDEEKAATNLVKHGIEFGEASTVFGDPFALSIVDMEHSIGEEREITFGLTQAGLPVVVAHTERSGTIRIISARWMTLREKRFYEENK